MSYKTTKFSKNNTKIYIYMGKCIFLSNIYEKSIILLKVLTEKLNVLVKQYKFCFSFTLFISHFLKQQCIMSIPNIISVSNLSMFQDIGKIGSIRTNDILNNIKHCFRPLYFIPRFLFRQCYS
jgi:hypothetical protein